MKTKASLALLFQILSLSLFLIATPKSLFAESAETSPLAPLKILTLNFNSENVPNDMTFFVRDQRFAAIQKWVRENDPDIILLEEAWNYKNNQSIATALAHAIDYDVSSRVEMGFFNIFYEAEAVLAKKSFKMSDRESKILPHSALEIGDGKTWVIELGAVSSSVGAKLKLPNGEPLFVYAVHLNGVNPGERADQANAVIEDVKARATRHGVSWDKTHVIIGGDFNSVASEDSPLLMAREGFIDSFGKVHPGDLSCSLCEVPSLPRFNPFTVAPGQFPSQSGDEDAVRIDYIFSHSPTFTPVSSTLTFTAPLQGVWMSDHYGVTSVLSPTPDLVVPNPTHDSPDTIPPAVIQPITAEMIDGVPYGGTPDELPNLTVNGSRGIVIENKSNRHFDVWVNGPGYIYTNHLGSLDPGERASFTFALPGDYTYIIQTGEGSAEPNNQIEILGKIHVENTGY